jgi:hypothetical protein
MPAPLPECTESGTYSTIRRWRAGRMGSPRLMAVADSYLLIGLNNSYLDDVKNLLVELEECIVSIDKDNLPSFKNKNWF